MRAKIIQIGNSKGLRLSKTMLKKYDFGEEVNLRLEESCIIIEPVPKARKGWEESFIQMRKNGDDEILLGDIFPDESFEEWT
ncbi:MAG: AbrB/MazE/SpoVT family DNA-binding domain-containing protein [Saprospiraceae bacterium]|nr:AbrB/MazE/SpoVT family DNA-binding domain-containing protein [Saprospiraceae bacterium]